MKLAKQFIFYLGLIIVFGGLIFYLLHLGKYQNVADIQIRHRLPEGGLFADIFRSNFQEALPRLLFQIIIIIIPQQLLAFLFKKNRTITGDRRNCSRHNSRAFVIWIDISVGISFYISS